MARVGEVIVRRDVHRGTVLSAIACVQTAEGYYVCPGAQAMIPSRGGLHRRAVEAVPGLADPGDAAWVEWSWRWTHVLALTEPARPFVTWVMWNEAWEFLGWKVNFEAPHRRTRLGFDTMDWTLDLTVTPDLVWARKDAADLGSRSQWSPYEVVPL